MPTPRKRSKSQLEISDKRFDSLEGQLFYGPSRRVVKEKRAGKEKPNFPFATDSSNRKKK